MFSSLVHSVMRITFGLEDTGEARLLNNTHTVLLLHCGMFTHVLCVQFLVAGEFLSFILYKFHWVWHVLH